ncbi:MAG TPA: hypothetical protein VFN62_04510 [Acidobacteriaceae bacterium]|nr:hypothetical protein [Acidobacteriaceae bacterium]
MTSHQAQAEELLSAMKLLMDDVGAYKSAVALLAVHCAIAFNDAVLEKLTGAVHKGQNHSEATKKTKDACVKNNIDSAGVRHLERLVASKNLYSYSGIVDFAKANDAADKAEKFANWANRAVLRGEPSNV